MNHVQVSDTWERGDPYERYVGRWSRRVAPLFLSWLQIPAGGRWLDVGCGTGALCAAIVDHCSPSSVVGVEPSPGFLETAKGNLAGRVALHQGSAAAIPLDDAAVDVVVSGLVLNFDITTPFASFDDYWRPFLGGQGPAPAYAMSLDETARARLRERIRERMPAEGDGSIALTARAWVVRATVAR